MDIAYKIWLERQNHPVFGIDICELLLQIRETGSINKAAKCMGMSYRTAWGKIRKNEIFMHAQLLEKGQHGPSGANLTKYAQVLLEYYEKITHEFDTFIEEGPVRSIIQEMNTAIAKQNTACITKPKDK